MPFQSVLIIIQNSGFTLSLIALATVGATPAIVLAATTLLVILVTIGVQAYRVSRRS